jgi:hypothetical protein
MQPVGDGMIVGVAFIHVAVAGSKVGGDKAKVGVMVLQTYRYRPFVT